MSVADKNILLLGLGFYDYEKAILDGLSKRFANAYYVSLKYQSLVGRILAHISPSLLRQIESDFVTKQIRKSPQNIDYVIIIKGEYLTEKHIVLLKQKYPSAKFLLYLWDSLANISNSSLLLEKFDNIYTFDRIDSIKYDLRFRPLFYRKSYEHEERLNKYDISFVGIMHSERYQILHRLKKEFDKHNIKYKFCLYTGKYTYIIHRYIKKTIDKDDGDFFIFKKMTYAQYLDLSLSSKIILDLAHPLQSGLTMRTIEAIGMKKKILTDNKDIIHYAMWNDRNYQVFDAKRPVIDFSFFSSEYVNDDLSYFSLDSFLDELIQSFR